MLNCAAIPAELIESELFGYERGAFTGAHGRKKGLFEVADGGTLFLDEIGDMSPSAQSKVLRALQSGEITRIGSERPIAVDVRVLAATNKDLEQEVGEGRFRDDLYFRLNVVPIRSPSLRERVDDIPLLAHAFFKHFGREYGGHERICDPEVFDLLKRRAWPGNVRELRNVAERMVILGGARLTAEDVPRDAPRRAAPEAPPLEPEATQEGAEFRIRLPASQLTLREFRDRAETAYLMATLRQCDWNISRAAGQLGIERTNLHKKMRAFGIRREPEHDARKDDAKPA
jgi:transcriptional regulator with GAF, ATPase, and Fis domain